VGRATVDVARPLSILTEPALQQPRAVAADVSFARAARNQSSEGARRIPPSGLYAAAKVDFAQVILRSFVPATFAWRGCGPWLRCPLSIAK
jgi:hypothetical protein